MEKELTTTVIQPAVTPMQLIARAQEANASIEHMEQLFRLQLQWEHNEAKKAFHKAVADFKTEAIDIVKNKQVKFETAKGITQYKHAELGQIVNTVVPLLSKYGLSHHWEYAQNEGRVKVTCYLTHELGYEKSTSLESAPDESGGKNSIQAIASATSYLERYTFLAINGLASREQDNDGKDADKDEVERISERQYFDLLALIAEVGADQAKFCTFYHINEPAELPLSKYDAAVKNLEKKRKT